MTIAGNQIMMSIVMKVIHRWDILRIILDNRQKGHNNLPMNIWKLSCDRSVTSHPHKVNFQKPFPIQIKSFYVNSIQTMIYMQVYVFYLHIRVLTQIINKNLNITPLGYDSY